MKSNKYGTLIACLFSFVLAACGGGGGNTNTPPPNTPPVAQAGILQNVTTGTLVTLNGSASSDANGDPLTYSWSLISKPTSSAASLAAATSTAPTFTADLAGTYVATLVVNDGQVNSTSASVTITASVANAAPVANAGTAQNVVTNTLVTLNGSASSDANGDPLTYSWSLTSKPAASTASLAGSTSATPTFTADLAGTYVATLIVNDGQVSSTAATVTITATEVIVNQSMVGSYIGDNTVTVAIVGSNLTLTWYDFFTGTCIYSAPISSATNAVGSGAYQCSDFTTGFWSLLKMKIVDSGDIYIEIVVNGTTVKRHFGMSGNPVLIAPTPILDNVPTLIGSYLSTLGTANTAVGFYSYAEDPTTITVGLSGTTLTITAVHFWAGTCIYTAAYSTSTNTVSAGTYQCSDFTTGSWTLSKMKLVSSNDVYIAISKNGSSNAIRMYGAK